MKTIAEYTTFYEATIAKGLLESEGIEAAITNNDSVFPGLGFMPNNTVRLAVNEPDVEKAISLLENTNFDDMEISEAELEAQAEAAAGDEEI